MSSLGREGYCEYSEYEAAKARRFFEGNIDADQLYQLFLRLELRRQALRSVVRTGPVHPMNGLSVLALELTFMDEKHQPKFTVVGAVHGGIWNETVPDPVLRVDRGHQLVDGVLAPFDGGEESDVIDLSDIHVGTPVLSGA